VDTRGKLRNIDFERIKYLFGLFNNNHKDYEQERHKTDSGEPSLEEMTESAISILSKNEKGFVLLVEGGRIDHSHHDNMAAMALHETLAFEKAIENAHKSLPTDETLIVVTTDHSHTLTINGYQKRGNPILEIAEDDSYSIPYTTLLYGFQ
jgi:alkaline phosphatase